MGLRRFETVNRQAFHCDWQRIKWDMKSDILETAVPNSEPKGSYFEQPSSEPYLPHIVILLLKGREPLFWTLLPHCFKRFSKIGLQTWIYTLETNLKGRKDRGKPG
ncbi:hypothetical protein PDE_04002 [Penicillium oxalicum 114-2]|uniref:Uncharacterized protein n=1 Tax=Penicillium oxalicum (strain 114-2 / CGMCC 5302) TaxID=933388 RepID=S7ZEG4_PENO1|nr:hypothetical protein PDE_04002 [Penicillium oxalicum 114-2]